jgi:hypothetical protein
VSRTGLEIDGDFFCGPVVLLPRRVVHRNCPCQTKVENLRLAPCSDEEVRGFNVAMNDSGVVRCIECVGNLAAPLEQLGKRHWASLQTA